MRVVIAGGGTGGHLYPGIAIAQEFLRRDRTNRILFIGTKRGIERKVIPELGFSIRYILSGGLKNLSFVKKMISLFKLPVSCIQSLGYLAGFRPDLVIGVGGYASGSVGLSSYMLNVPLAIQEQNIRPGMTNKILGRLASVIFTSFNETGKLFDNRNVRHTGNPVRQEITIRENVKKELAQERFTILIFGGSQGAHAINKALIDSLSYMGTVKEKLYFIHQTGASDFKEVESGYRSLGFMADVSPFIKDMATAYKKANLVVSRAGATSIAEICASGKAAILVPYPYAADNHQEHNARGVEEKGGAKMILESDLSGSGLAEELLIFLKDKKKIRSMAESIALLGCPKAAEDIVGICYELVGMNV